MFFFNLTFPIYMSSHFLAPEGFPFFYLTNLGIQIAGMPEVEEVKRK